jgi:hypothetical protein
LDIRVITSLDLASNNLGAEGAKVIAEAIKVTQCVCDYFGIIFVSISLNSVCYYPQDMRALACKSGTFYHEWVLNPNFHGTGPVLEASREEVSAQLGRAVKGRARKAVVAPQPPLPPRQYKYVSIAPDVYGQDDDPDLSKSHQCLRCGQHKSMHSVKGAMTSLNLTSNKLGPEGAKIVADAIKVTKCTPAIILEPFSCPSDFSINCCCLLLSAGYEGTIVPIFVQEWAAYQRGRQSSWRHAQG